MTDDLLDLIDKRVGRGRSKDTPRFISVEISDGAQAPITVKRAEEAGADGRGYRYLDILSPLGTGDRALALQLPGERTLVILGKIVSADALRVTEGAGLNINYAAGRARIDQTVFDIVAGSLLMVNATTNYVFINSAGAVASNTTGFPAISIPLAQVVTAGGAITSVADKRCIFYEDTAAGGGGDGGGVDAEWWDDFVYEGISVPSTFYTASRFYSTSAIAAGPGVFYCSTLASAGAAAYCRQTAQFYAIRDPTMIVGAMGPLSTDVEAFIGYDSGSQRASSHIAFWYDSAVNGNWWASMRKGTGVITEADTGIPVSPTSSDWNSFKIVVTSAEVKAEFYIDGVLKATLSGATYFPTGILNWDFHLENVSGAAGKQFHIDYLLQRWGRPYYEEPAPSAGMAQHANEYHNPDMVSVQGDQIVAGIKTFSSIPELPAVDPTTDNQAVRKAYVDSLSGVVGVVGAPGLDGLDGEDGAVGPPGQFGAAGATGPQGTAGFPGPPGIDGVDGEPGVPGQAGAAGATGAAGSIGPTGAGGSPGIDGIDGEPGFPIPGATGAQGNPGPVGAAGSPGWDGEDGGMGPPGPAGAGGGAHQATHLAGQSDALAGSIRMGASPDNALQDSGGTVRITIATASPFITMGDVTQNNPQDGNTLINGKLGLGTNAPTIDAYAELNIVGSPVGSPPSRGAGAVIQEGLSTNVPPGNIVGLWGLANWGGDVSGTLCAGLYFDGQCQFYSGTLAALEGIRVRLVPKPFSPAAVTNARGLHVLRPIGSAGCPRPVNLAGIYIEDMHSAAGTTTPTTVIGIKIDDISGGTAAYLLELGPATPNLRLEAVAPAVSGESKLLLAFYDGAAVALKRVLMGAADSGGVGYRLLRVAN